MSNRTIKAAFTDSLPVLMGYVSMGAAFGVLLATQVPGAGAGTAFAMSISTISGSMQFAAVEMLKHAELYSLGLTALLAVLINIRYAMYGIPFIRLFRNYPWYLRSYLTICLTDETYAILTRDRRHGRDKRLYFLCVSAFDHGYWVIGSVLGAAAGRSIPFNAEGIDFAMAALFLVILIDLCREKSNRVPALVGAVSTLVVLALFLECWPQHVNKLLLPAMILMVGALLAGRKKLEPVPEAAK